MVERVFVDSGRRIHSEAVILQNLKQAKNGRSSAAQDTGRGPEV